MGVFKKEVTVVAGLLNLAIKVNGKRIKKSFSDKKFGGSANAKREAETWLIKIEADYLRGQVY